MLSQAFYVKAEWDDDEKVWFIDSTNVPGLNVEAATREELLSLLDDLVPDLLEANGAFGAGDGLPTIPYSLMFNQLQASRATQ